jgi:hypothetical protein
MKRSHTTAKSIDDRVVSRIRRRGKGAVFTPSEFLDLGSRSAIDVVLHRLVKKKMLRRLCRGLYDSPKCHPVLGFLTPPPEVIAEALAGRDRTRLQPAGAYAANVLGLSDQVPAKVVFLTDGPSRSVTVGLMVIQLKRTTAKNMAAAGTVSGLVIQALRELGAKHVTVDRVNHLKRTLPKKARSQLLGDLAIAPAWMHSIIREIAGGAR